MESEQFQTPEELGKKPEEILTEAPDSEIFFNNERISLSRPITEVKEKWEKRKEKFGVTFFSKLFSKDKAALEKAMRESGEVLISISKDGSIACHNGNTRIYAASLYSISPENIPAQYNNPEGEVFHGNLADAISLAKTFRGSNS